MARKLENLRNIGIIAHIDAGKTTVTERMLFYAGATHKMGEVDKGTTETDFDEEEQQRGITIYSACVTFQWKDIVVNLIDTPGHVDFTAEVERCLRVLDGGVIVFSAREGVEAQSETVWRQADRYHVPRIALVNKMDREGADFQATFKEIGARLEGKPVAIQIPVGAGPPHQADAFAGIIDLVTMKMLTFAAEDQGTQIHESDVPDRLRDEALAWRGRMLEALYDYSDELMELALGEEAIPAELIRRVIRSATIHSYIQPVLCGSALDYVGIQPLLDAVAYYLPSPADMPSVEGTNPKKKDATERRKPSAKEPFCGLVFKVVADRHGDFCYVRVYSGELAAGTRVLNSTKDKKENVPQLWHLQADSREQVKSVTTGDIVGVVGLRHSVTGDTLCSPKDPIVLEQIVFPETVVSMAIEPESSAERKKLAETLEIMKRQDPTFRAIENEETGQTLISGMGELHLEVIKHRLLRDFNLDVKVHQPRVSYRETVERAVEVEGHCNRQIAGRLLSAQVRIRIEPVTKAALPVVISVAPGVELPGELLGTALEALREQGEGGGALGFPLMRVKITLLAAEVSEGDQSEVALRIAAADAVHKALGEDAAGIVLLEPIMKLEIITPEEHVGDFVGDLQQRRAIIHQTQTRGKHTIIEAEAPLASLFGYSSAMRSLSQGRATSSMEPSSYGPAPPAILKSFL